MGSMMIMIMIMIAARVVSQSYRRRVVGVSGGNQTTKSSEESRDGDTMLWRCRCLIAAV